MPNNFEHYLRNLSNDQADILWEWFDNNSDAAHAVILTLVDSHSELTTKGVTA
jgi:hypothetical protein